MQFTFTTDGSAHRSARSGDPPLVRGRPGHPDEQRQQEPAIAGIRPQRFRWHVPKDSRRSAHAILQGLGCPLFQRPGAVHPPQSKSTMFHQGRSSGFTGAQHLATQEGSASASSTARTPACRWSSSTWRLRGGTRRRAACGAVRSRSRVQSGVPGASTRSSPQQSVHLVPHPFIDRHAFLVLQHPASGSLAPSCSHTPGLRRAAR